MVLFLVHLVDKGIKEKEDTLDPKEKKVYLNIIVLLLLASGTHKNRTNESKKITKELNNLVIIYKIC